MNKWMNDPQYLAQVGHSLGGFALILTLRVFFGPFWMLVGLILGLMLAAGKEFWYDMKYELPAQTWFDSVMDFGFYLLGASVGVIVASLAADLHRLT
jgi:hypothetical protein